jgi:trehalose-phosphatase
MEYLFSHWDKLENRLSGKSLFLFLDYDGTLTPIVEIPDKALISRQTKSLLNKLSKKSHCSVAIISGRSLNDIKTIVGIKEITYVGNHGLEIEGPKIKFESRVSSRLKLIMRRIYEDAICEFSKIKGVLVEDKGLAITIHYRLVDEKDLQKFLTVFNEITHPYIVRSKIKINSGKKVYEIKPPLIWDKGKVVLWLLARQQFLSGENKVFPVYIGDDVTDDDAFRALKNKGLTIFVGGQKVSEASYYLEDTVEVSECLSRLLKIKEKI